MIRFIDSLLHRWLDRSTGPGIWLRYVRRQVHTRLRRKNRRLNVAMLHAGRCGSSVLADLLKQHPGFRWAGEPFEDMLPAYYGMNDARRAEHVIGNSMYLRDARYYGFDSKILPEQHLHPKLANCTPAQYVELLDRLGFTHFILLDRRNHLRRAISVAIGQRTGVWNAGRRLDQRVVRLDPDRFRSYGAEMPLREYFRSLERRHEEFRVLLRGRRFLELVYEDDVERDPLVGYRKTCAFLGLEPLPVQVRLAKMNPERLADMIENFAEVERALAGTPDAWMLKA